MDIKESDGLISMAYLYQDKELIERHGIGVIIGKQYYRIGIAPEIGTTLNKNSKIIKITDNEIEFTFVLNYICLFDYLFISSQMSAKPYFIGSTGILLLW